MSKSKIPVFLSADNVYAPFVATAIASICEHTQAFVDFYVLDGGISDGNKLKIKDISNKFSNFSLEFIPINAEQTFSKFANNLHYTKTMFSRFLIPQLKPELGKVLYSDVDVIFLDDIQKMYDENIEDYAIGAVEECWLSNAERKKMLEAWGTSLDHKIFASGNLILDCEKWRKCNIAERLFEINNNKHNYDLWVDQILLNIFFSNNYKVLPAKYCYTIQHDACFGKIEDIVVCHFNGEIKPWYINENTKTINMPYLKEFWYYAKMTPFYDELKSKTLDEKQQKENLIKLQAWRFKIKLASMGKCF